MKKLIVLMIVLVAFGFQAMAAFGAGQKKWEIVLVAKLEHPMFDAMEKGFNQANKDFPDIHAYKVAPAEADAAQQVALVEDQIAKGVNAIIVVPNDPGALEPVFKKATDSGILTFTHESVLSNNIKFDIEAFDNVAFGRHFMDNLVKYMGNEGGYVCFVGNLTAVTHNQWVDAEIAWQKEKYPKLKLLRDRMVSDESTEVAYQKTLELIKTYGAELKGIIGSSASTAPGAGIAVAEKGLQDKIAVVGTGTPKMAAAGLEDGSIKVVSIWDPVKIGYACAWIARELLNGGQIKDGMEVPKLGKITIKGKVIYGDVSGIMDFKKDNYKDYLYF